MTITGSTARKREREKNLKKKKITTPIRVHLRVYDVHQPEKEDIWCCKIIT